MDHRVSQVIGKPYLNSPIKRGIQIFCLLVFVFSCILKCPRTSSKCVISNKGGAKAILRAFQWHLSLLVISKVAMLHKQLSITTLIQIRSPGWIHHALKYFFTFCFSRDLPSFLFFWSSANVSSGVQGFGMWESVCFTCLSDCHYYCFLLLDDLTITPVWFSNGCINSVDINEMKRKWSMESCTGATSVRPGNIWVHLCFTCSPVFKFFLCIWCALNAVVPTTTRKALFVFQMKGWLD